MMMRHELGTKRNIFGDESGTLGFGAFYFNHSYGDDGWMEFWKGRKGPDLAWIWICGWGDSFSLSLLND